MQSGQNQIATEQSATQIPQTTPQPTPQAGMLAHSGEDNAIADLEATGSRIYIWLIRIVTALLTLQSLYNLYQSISFVFVDIPLLDVQLSQGMVERDTVVVLATRAVIKVISAMVSMFLAVRLTKSQAKANEKIGIAFSIFMVVANTFIIDFFRRVDVDLLISNTSQFILQYFLTIPERIFSLLPF